ncbi:putative quinol monooxygenase [Shewanella atlantica]|uniref:Antibiotic biosynthesis monooxygenase n=1 Tax=Shewanella atlantica TaxID=271099 RepID=A0A431WHZ5_9GAMM|nr:putative quinol monooxygenase [Shewanella atlantica]RTR34977.1 antibiotic biosynthesis monooxygenase [Shewanella atlantica]
MNILTVVARIEAKQDQVQLVKAELIKLIEPTRKELGCLQYDLHQDNERPELFVFYEGWQSKALLQAHLGSEHIEAYLKAVDGAVASFVISEMTKIG